MWALKVLVGEFCVLYFCFCELAATMSVVTFGRFPKMRFCWFIHLTFSWLLIFWICIIVLTPVLCVNLNQLIHGWLVFVFFCCVYIDLCSELVDDLLKRLITKNNCRAPLSSCCGYHTCWHTQYPLGFHWTLPCGLVPRNFVAQFALLSLFQYSYVLMDIRRHLLIFVIYNLESHTRTCNVLHCVTNTDKHTHHLICSSLCELKTEETDGVHQHAVNFFISFYQRLNLNSI